LLDWNASGEACIPARIVRRAAIVAAVRTLAAEFASYKSEKRFGMAALELLGSASRSAAISDSDTSSSQANLPESPAEPASNSVISEVLHRMAKSIQILHFHVAPLMDGRGDMLIVEEQIQIITGSIHQLTRALKYQSRHIA
jgi:hypothetical protein